MASSRSACTGSSSSSRTSVHCSPSFVAMRSSKGGHAMSRIFCRAHSRASAPASRRSSATLRYMASLLFCTRNGGAVSPRPPSSNVWCAIAATSNVPSRALNPGSPRVLYTPVLVASLPPAPPCPRSTLADATLAACRRPRVDKIYAPERGPAIAPGRAPRPLLPYYWLRPFCTERTLLYLNPSSRGTAGTMPGLA